MKNGYIKCMELAGAKILAAKKFGSYQGDWWAKVEYKGKTFWVHGYFGSCSGCDAFQAEFGYDETSCEEHRYLHNQEITDTCEACKVIKQDLHKRKVAFGEKYLTDDVHSQESAEAFAAKHESWDFAVGVMLKWIQENKI